MASTLALYKKDLVAAAARLGNINDFEKFPKNENLLANGYLECETRRNETLDMLKQMDVNPDLYTAEEYEALQIELQNLERKMESYLAALLLRHWKDINNLYQKCKTCDSKNRLEDFSSIVYERIMYAFKYKAWLTNPKLNAQQCINMAISTEVKNQMYFSNLQKNVANATAHNTSLDKAIGTSSDDRETTLADTIADETSGYAFSRVDGVIQEYINNNKVVEAIVIDTIANNPVMRQTSETKTMTVERVDSKTGELVEDSIKYKENYVEFWRYKAAEFLMNLPKTYVEDFQKRFDISAEILAKAFEAISTAKNQKVYRYLDNTIADLRNNREVLMQMLSK